MNNKWKLLYNDKRRCRIFSCGESNVCCADCKKEDCKRRCLNSPERCGQVIQREEKRTETSGPHREQSKQRNSQSRRFTRRSRMKDFAGAT